jgi:hypothetical protein
LFDLEESLELLFKRPAVTENLSYDHIPDCALLNTVHS